MNNEQYANFFDMFFCIKLYNNNENDSNNEKFLEKLLDESVKVIITQKKLGEYKSSFDNRLCATGIKDVDVIYEHCIYLYNSINLIKYSEGKRIIYKKVFFLYIFLLFCIDKNDVIIKKLGGSTKIVGLENIIFQHRKKEFLARTFIPNIRKMYDIFINSDKIIKIPTEENENLVQQCFNQDGVCKFYIEIVNSYNQRIIK